MLLHAHHGSTVHTKVVMGSTPAHCSSSTITAVGKAHARRLTSSSPSRIEPLFPFSTRVLVYWLRRPLKTDSKKVHSHCHLKRYLSRVYRPRQTCCIQTEQEQGRARARGGLENGCDTLPGSGPSWRVQLHGGVWKGRAADSQARKTRQAL